MNLLKFKNMLRLGIVGLFQKGAQEGANAATQSGRDAKILSDAAIGTGAVTTTTAFFPLKLGSIFSKAPISFKALIPLADRARFIDLPAGTEFFLISGRASYTSTEKPSEDK